MKYLATAVVVFAAGAELGLSKDQASSRRHTLTEHPKRKGWYTATGSVQFKSGEEFQFDGTMPKGMASAMEPQQKTKPTKPESDGQAASATLAALTANSDLVSVLGLPLTA